MKGASSASSRTPSSASRSNVRRATWWLGPLSRGSRSGVVQKSRLIGRSPFLGRAPTVRQITWPPASKIADSDSDLVGRMFPDAWPNDYVSIHSGADADSDAHTVATVAGFPPRRVGLHQIHEDLLERPDYSRITHSRHRTALGGHHRTPAWSISYSRGRRGGLSDTGVTRHRHGSGP